MPIVYFVIKILLLIFYVKGSVSLWAVWWPHMSYVCVCCVSATVRKIIWNVPLLQGRRVCCHCSRFFCNDSQLIIAKDHFSPKGSFTKPWRIEAHFTSSSLIITQCSHLYVHIHATLFMFHIYGFATKHYCVFIFICAFYSWNHTSHLCCFIQLWSIFDLNANNSTKSCIMHISASSRSFRALISTKIPVGFITLSLHYCPGLVKVSYFMHK